MSKTTTLLLLSGGLDSTTCLFKLLEETKSDVHTFYVGVENNNSKMWCEKEAIKRLREIKTRDYTHHSASEFDITGQSKRGLQPFMWMTAGVLMLNKIDGPAKRLCIGYTQGDTATDAVDQIRDEWAAIWNMLGDDQKRMPPLHLPLLKQTKAQSMDYLRRLEQKKGIQIINNLWTCEDPKRFHGPDGSGYRACKECLPCKRGLEIGFVQP
jgi:7-cyano-7-deazaguanine synthase in queuosine biosynthesis